MRSMSRKGFTKTMETLKKSFPKDVDYVVPFEAVSVVKVSIDEVVADIARGPWDLLFWLYSCFFRAGVQR